MEAVQLCNERRIEAVNLGMFFASSQPLFLFFSLSVVFPCQTTVHLDACPYKTVELGIHCFNCLSTSDSSGL